MHILIFCHSNLNFTVISIKTVILIQSFQALKRLVAFIISYLKITFTAYLYGESDMDDTNKIIEEDFPFRESNPGHLGESEES